MNEESRMRLCDYDKLNMFVIVTQIFRNIKLSHDGHHIIVGVVAAATWPIGTLGIVAFLITATLYQKILI